MTISLCRLYVTIAPHSDGGKDLESLGRILDAGDVACIRLRTDGADDSFADFARDVISLAHSRDIAVLVDDDVTLAQSVGADGVHLTGELGQYPSARAMLGENGIIGIDCTGSRDKAMSAGEQGADYVCLSGENPETVNWWTQLFEVPCVAQLDDNADHTRAVISGGVEFVAIDCDAGNGSSSAAETVAGIDSMIREIGKELD